MASLFGPILGDYKGLFQIRCPDRTSVHEQYDSRILASPGIPKPSDLLLPAPVASPRTARTPTAISRSECGRIAKSPTLRRSELFSILASKRRRLRSAQLRRRVFEGQSFILWVTLGLICAVVAALIIVIHWSNRADPLAEAKFRALVATVPLSFFILGIVMATLVQSALRSHERITTRLATHDVRESRALLLNLCRLMADVDAQVHDAPDRGEMLVSRST